MTLEEVIDIFINSHCHIYLSTGAYVNKDYELVFNKIEHDKLFSYGYYVPDYKEWLKENAELKCT